MNRENYSNLLLQYAPTSDEAEFDFLLVSCEKIKKVIKFWYNIL
jgi:hypothetical protein